MNIFDFTRRIVCVASGTATLTACSIAGTSQPPPWSVGNHVGATADTSGRQPVETVPTGSQHFQTYFGRSWMEPDASKHRLLYVSDFNNSIVQVYNYPSRGSQNPPAGTLTGFSNPRGMCVDKHNNVYITNTAATTILKYKYGDTNPTATYGPLDYYTLACAVDPTTGNLAVSLQIISQNSPGPADSVGSVFIFTDPSHGTFFPAPGGLEACYYLGYDALGNLYLDGVISSRFAMAYLAAGSNAWQAVSFSGAAINSPGNVQYDGTYLTVGDQSGPSGYSVIHQCDASGASVDCSVGQTNLLGSSDVVQYFIKRGVKGVIGPDFNTGNANTWAYPAGGKPRPNKIIHVGQGYPGNVGAALLLGNGQ